MTDVVFNVLAFIGFLTTTIIVLWWFLSHIEYENSNEVFFLTVFGFGILKARTQKMMDSISKIRKKDECWTTIVCPTWFNKYIINLSGLK